MLTRNQALILVLYAEYIMFSSINLSEALLTWKKKNLSRVRVMRIKLFDT